MLFPTYQFLLFFAIVFPLYWKIGSHRLRLAWLLVASAAFYFSSFFFLGVTPWLLLLIIASTLSSYLSALAMDRSPSPRARTAWLIAGIGFNLGILAYFKYANFFLDSVRAVAASFGFPATGPLLDLVLPLGISFYTFETISYLVDVHQRRIPPARSLFDYAIFILFFPHLVAGPIVRPRDFLNQLQHPKTFRWSRAALGVRLFLVGFIKKSVIADHLARVADPVFAEPASYGSLSIWAAVFAYSIQIYCDFSGYSDMAIGLAHLFGFKLPANFNFPYLATDIADFWRRWHISLSSWLRDYLYIPLGGSRLGTWITYRNLIIVMLLGGLWHGAQWTFVIWGLYHGVLLALHRALPWPSWLATPRGRIVSIASTFLLVTVGWVFFRAATLADAGLILHRLIAPALGESLKPATLFLGFAGVALIVAANLVNSRLRWTTIERRVPVPLLGAALAVALIFAQLAFPAGGKTFIYFQF
jgi:alginate O-acetyltransferase complex protein AlgI